MTLRMSSLRSGMSQSLSRENRPPLQDSRFCVRETFALSPATVEAALTANTRAVVLVHIGGLIPPDVLALRQLCDERAIVLFYDAAQAYG
jgi:cysteine sulfinate desulfinase/cysteine desulfurase-like protein